jgi:predicted nuclease with TOPRIM domain
MDVGKQADGEVNAGVDRLVSEIDRAVHIIENLRRESAELKQQCKTLQANVSRLEGDLSELRIDRERLQRIYNENASLIDNKAEIQNKIEAMLSRLDVLNQETANADA